MIEGPWLQKDIKLPMSHCLRNFGTSKCPLIWVIKCLSRKKIYVPQFLKQRYIITINVPLCKKLRDISFFLRDYNFLSHFEGHFEGASTFFSPKLSLAALSARDNLGVKKVEAPSKCPSKWLIKWLSQKKYGQKFLKQWYIGNFMYPSAVVCKRGGEVSL